MYVDWEYYKIFYYVAKYQNFTKAARVLGSNQPNITHTMNKLEAQLHCVLFIRSNRGVTLTPEGETLYARIASAAVQIQDAEAELSASTTLTHGTISIEDNLGTGSVVTISANGSNPQLPKELEINHVEEDEDAEHPEPTAPRYRIAEEDHEPAYNAQPAYAQPSAQYAPGFAAQPPMQAYQQAPQMAYAAPQQFAQPGYAPATQQGYMQAPIQQPMGYPYGQQMQLQIQPAPVDAQPIIASLSQREKDFLVIYLKEGVLGVSDVVKLTGAAQSSVHNTLKKLEGIGLLKMSGKKRMLTNLGIQVAQLL